MRPWPVVWTLLLLVAILAAPAPADAQGGARVYRIGVLANALETADGPNFEAFLAGLAKLGYVGDKNLDIEWRSSEGDFELLPNLAADLVRSKVDLIVATSLQPARAAAAATKTIPIVFVVGADPVAHGLVGNVERPGGNVTGLATYQPEQLSSRVLQLLREVAPGLSRLAVLTNPSNPVHRELARPLAAAAQRATMTLVPLEIRGLHELPAAFEAASRERAQALYVLGDVISFIYRTRIVDLAARNRLPAIYPSRRAVEVGGLMSYGPDLRDLFRRAATYVDRILKGARPGDIGVEQPTKFELAVNLKTARSLGLNIPEALRRRADHVVQ
jgi:putative ABC transport system substrate-binding protein